MNRTIWAAIAAGVVPVIVLITASRGINLAQNGFQSSTFDLQKGKSIFAAKCARCHNISGSSAAAGPNLSLIGSVAANRKQGMNAPEYILESILTPRAFKAPGTSGEMPVNLVRDYDDDSVRSLVAYLCSLDAVAHDEEIQSLIIQRPENVEDHAKFEFEQVMRGEQLYRGKAGCSACHPYYGGKEYELLAPYLLYRGFRDRPELLQSIEKPHDKVQPKYQQAIRTLLSGKSLTGLLISQSESEMVMLVREQGQIALRTIPVSDIDTEGDQTMPITHQPISDMPSGVEKLLTADELEALVEFLLSLN